MAWCDPCVPRPQTARATKRCEGLHGAIRQATGGAATAASTTPLDRIRSAARRTELVSPTHFSPARCDPTFFYPPLPAVSTNGIAQDTPDGIRSDPASIPAPAATPPGATAARSPPAGREGYGRCAGWNSTLQKSPRTGGRFYFRPGGCISISLGPLPSDGRRGRLAFVR